MTAFAQNTTLLLFAASALFLAAVLPFLLLLRRIDRRRLGGDAIWSKPFNFALSIAVHLATFAVIARALPPAMLDGPGLRLAAVAAVTASLFECGYIAVQAARGRRSHFNTSTRLETVMTALMGLGAIAVLLPSVVIGIDMLSGPLPGWAWSVRAGVAAGLLGGAALTLVTGLRMGAAASHFAAPPPATSRTMRLTGWSLDGADLRPAHFLAAHMMQGVPLAALFAALVLPERAALIATILLACGWAALTVQALSWASSGRPLPRILGLAAVRSR